MNKRETHIVTGMTRDLSVGRFDNKFVVDARNIRITAIKGNSTLLSVTNEKGTGILSVDGTIEGVILGHAVLNKTLVLFTTEHTILTNADPIPNGNGLDRIYRLDFSDGFDSATATLLFQGNLNFYYKNPLETLPYYETESIRKVYWVDGRNQPRMINIENGLEENGDVFNFNRKIEGKHTFEITKHNIGGEFPAGTIQYCFNYFNKFGQETNIVDVSPLYYLCPKDKGLPADGIDTSSFTIIIGGADPNYEYVRVYSIIRTSENATPRVRIVGDYKIATEEVIRREYSLGFSTDISNVYLVDNNFENQVPLVEAIEIPEGAYVNINIPLNGGYIYNSEDDKYYSYYLDINDDKVNSFPIAKIGDIIESTSHRGITLYCYGEGTSNESKRVTIIDNGIIGSTLDYTALLFIGGQDIIAGTLATKDNTLFLGNIKQNVPNIGNIELYSGVELKDYVKGSGSACAFDYRGNEISEFIINNDDDKVSEDFYDYIVDNNRSSFQIKSFKARENYRLGFIAQYNTGQWSEAVWVGDYDETISPGVNLFIDDNGQVSWGKSYHKPGFKVVLDSGTVTGLKNAGFIRVAPIVIYPNDTERFVLYQGILASSVYNVKDRSTNSPFAQSDWRFRPGYKWTNIENEIQTNYGPRHGVLPIIYNSTNDALINGDDFVDLFPTEFYRDSNILTFHSPDIECAESISNIKNLKCRIVGFSNAGFDSSKNALQPKSKISYYIETKTNGFYTYASIANGPVEVDGDDSLMYVGYKDIPLRESSSDSEIEKYGILREHSVEYPDRWSGLNRFVVSYNGDPAYEWNGRQTLYSWYTYLWHRSGSLNNQPKLSSKGASLNGIRTADLQKKCIAEFKYGRTTFLQGEIFNAVGPDRINVDELDSIAISDPLDMSMQTLGSSSKTYYGNIDKVIVPSFKNIPENYVDIFGNPVEWEYGIYGYPIGFDSYESTYKEGNAADYSPANMPKYATTIFYYPDSSHHPPVAADGEEQDGFFGDDPVVMKYRSVRHAIVKLLSDDSDLYTFGKFGNNNDFQNAPLFWDDNESVTVHKIPIFDNITEFSGYSGFDDGLYIAELYREFTPDQKQGRFGGTSESAISNGTWVRCGESVKLDNTTTLYYREGDTYLGRYDFLKTYPMSEQDINQVISIYSTEIESRVNLDARYDRYRGSLNNIYVRPTTFNLFNHPGYEQTNQFFTFKAIDYDRYRNLNYPNLVSFTTEKKPGADVDAWTSVPMTSTFDLKGDLGEITKLASFNDTLLSFQNRGVAQILFNERVQIPTSDGQPIEITNGLKFGGYRYLSDQIGMTNKWSLQTTPNGVYFIDDEKNTLYHFNGQQFQDLSGKAGFRTWLAENNSYDVWNPVEYSNFKTWYDRVNGDLYFMNKDESLVYSEQIGNFISFMDYGELPLFVNMNDKFLSAKYNSVSGENSIWELWAGQYNMFFGQYKPYWLTFVSNTDPTTDKIFNNLSWRTFDYSEYRESDNTGILQPMKTFDTLRVWHDHQDSGDVELTNTLNKPSPLKKKFNVFRALVPRDKLGLYARAGKDRIRNTWTYIQLSRYNPNTDLMIFNDLDVDFFE